MTFDEVKQGLKEKPLDTIYITRKNGFDYFSAYTNNSGKPSCAKIGSLTYEVTEDFSEWEDELKDAEFYIRKENEGSFDFIKF